MSLTNTPDALVDALQGKSSMLTARKKPDWGSLNRAPLGQRSESEPPWRGVLEDQQPVLRPRIGSQAVGDLGGVRGPHDEQHVGRALERSAELDEFLLVQPVHERGMGGPADLVVQRLRLIPTRPAGADHRDETF